MAKKVVLFVLLFLVFVIEARSQNENATNDFGESGPVLEATHIEVDIQAQELRIIKNGIIGFHCPVSTGIWKGSTPEGIFRIYATSKKRKSFTYAPKDKDGNVISPIVLINSLTFTKGRNGNPVHIHALEGQTYEKKLGKPASHGCVRVSRKDSIAIYEWVSAFKEKNGIYPQVYVH